MPLDALAADGSTMSLEPVINSLYEIAKVAEATELFMPDRDTCSSPQLSGKDSEVYC